MPDPVFDRESFNRLDRSTQEATADAVGAMKTAADAGALLGDANFDQYRAMGAYANAAGKALVGLAALTLAALALAACEVGNGKITVSMPNPNKDPNAPKFDTVGEFERFAYSDLYTGCVKFHEVEACEKMRSGGVEGDLYERNYLVHLRDLYARRCGRGDDDGCFRMSRLLRDIGQLGPSDSRIDDGDRLWWRSCLLEQQSGNQSGDSCKIVFGQGQYSLERDRDGSRAEALRADHHAGGQEGLLARVTDGAVVGMVPDIAPDDVRYEPPATDAPANDMEEN